MAAQQVSFARPDGQRRHIRLNPDMKPEPPETIEVNETTVSCDGDGGALGHPRVFLTLDADGKVECPYCDRLFVRGKSG